MSPVRKDLDPEYRARLRRIIETHDLSEKQYRSIIREGINAGEQASAIAREIGIDRRLLWQWIRRWEKEERLTE